MMGWLIDYLDNKVSENDYSFRRGIGVKEIFPGEKEPNIRLYREFIKLYELKLPGTLYSFYSKISIDDH